MSSVRLPPDDDRQANIAAAPSRAKSGNRPGFVSSFGFSLAAIHAQAGASSRKAGSAHSDDMSRSR
jgi:hypothetical protein